MERAGRAARFAALPATLMQAPERRGQDDSVRHLLFATPVGRIFWVALAVRLGLAWLHRARPDVPALVDVLTVAAGLTVGVTLVLLVVRLWGIARRRLLWRVRRKLILSYVFIGVVPVVLVVALMLFAGALMFLHVSAFLFKRGFDDVVDEARVAAETAVVEVERTGGRNTEGILARKVASLSYRFPGVSVALARRPAEAGAPIATASAGPWEHAEPPDTLPGWLATSNFGGLLAFAGPDDAEPHVVARAVRFPDGDGKRYAVIVDIPVGPEVQRAVRDATGIALTSVGGLALSGDGRPVSARPNASRPVTVPAIPEGDGWQLNSLTFFEFVDWPTGESRTVTLGIRVAAWEVFERLAAAQSRLGPYSLSELFLLVLGIIAALFLVIEVAALVMGFALARSITGSIHQLFEGTQRVREGDFAHRIEVSTRDQLGELADSFNEMTGSIENLLRQAEEKRRLEGELRIAREIQMSLLPRGAVQLPGITVSALCVPAREVGGDYYDFFALGDGRLGLLVADVAGQGTSAALYMAELKGLLLSLSKIHDSPRSLLSQVNHVLADNLDSRSFITMTYAIVDVAAGTLTYARAGHTPLLHYTACGDGRRHVVPYAPDGLVVGLRIEGVAARFDQLLQECTLPLRPGDVFVFYTDGISEAMNGAADLFGEDRLRDLVAEHGHLPADDLRTRIVAEVEAFVAGADQHDDMTMILVRVDGAEGAAAPHGPVPS
ncbi:MAG: SpoIIE family protein phosphatase [Vicinamibacterales bacterium]|nr:SpoIIE family protein phosphatase [Vicinamibacterales bacterium]